MCIFSWANTNYEIVIEIELASTASQCVTFGHYLAHYLAIFPQS